MVHAVYHYERCSWCGQLDVKYSGKVDISVDKIFLFKLFFLGLFSVCLPNIYFNMLEYLSTLDLLSYTLLHKDIQHFWHLPSYSSGWMSKHAFMSIFVIGHQRIILTGVLPITHENFVMIRWQEHCETGVTNRQMDRIILTAAWSQLKKLTLLWRHTISNVNSSLLDCPFKWNVQATSRPKFCKPG